MATKPATTFTHSTDANFGSGPATGFPTKLPVPSAAQGFVPGTGIAAEQVNTQFNILGDWLTNWLILGSNLAGLDAHVVETNAGGETRIATMVGGNTAHTEPALNCIDNTGDFRTAQITNSQAAGIALLVGGQSTGQAADISNAGVGVGLNVTSTLGGGITCTAGASAAGLTATGGSTGGTGVAGVGQVNGHGGYFQSGNNGAGVSVLGDPASNSPAAEFFGAFVAAAQVRGTWYAQPTPSTPSGPLDGDFWKRPGTVSSIRGGLEWYDAAGGPLGTTAGKQRAHSTAAGFGYGYAETLGDTSDDGTATVDAVTLNMGSNAGDFTQPDGNYVVEYSATVRLGATTLVATEAIVTFVGPAGSVVTKVGFSAVSERRSVSFFVRHALVNPGTDIFKIQIASDGAPAGVTKTVTLDNARIVARGAYE